LIGPKDINLADHQLVPCLPIRPPIPTSVFAQEQSVVCWSAKCKAPIALLGIAGAAGFLLLKFCNKEKEKKKEHKDGIGSSISSNGGGK
jgi:hypothetical protein